MLTYIKVLLLFGGAIILGTLSLNKILRMISLEEIDLYTLFFIWLCVLLVQSIIFYCYLGLRSTISAYKFLLPFFIIWSLVASLLGNTCDCLPYWNCVFKIGPLRACRVANCYLYAFMVVSTISPVEINRAKLFPRALREFILMFRTFTVMFRGILSDALDQLNTLGFPTFGNLVKSLFSIKQPFPTHGVFHYSIVRRWRYAYHVLIELLIYYIERILTIEVPEMGLSVKYSMQSKGGERNASNKSS